MAEHAADPVRSERGERPRPETTPADMDQVIEVVPMMADGKEVTTETAAAIGALALGADTIPEHRWIATLDRMLGDLDWPETDLWITDRVAAVRLGA